MVARLMAAAAAAFLLLLAACGDPSKHEIIKKAEGAKNKAQLEEALGAPDDVGKVGPVERWTYTAADGEVVFVIVGDSVSLQVTGGDGG